MSSCTASFSSGSFTPTFGGADTAGTTTYVTQVGAWCKAGRMVHCTIVLEWSNVTGSSGNAQIGNLPFTSSSSFEQVGTLVSENYTGTPIAVHIAPGGTVCHLVNNGGVEQSVDTAAKLWATFTYITNEVS